MDRRTFIGTLAGSLLAAPLAVEAQPGKIYRVGFVSPTFGGGPGGLAFNRGLRDSGLIEGENVLIDRQFMGGREDQYPAVLGDLERRVDVIVVLGPPAALATKKVVRNVPGIFAAVGDPVAIGLVQSMAKPGSNFTGVAFDVSPDIAIKRLGLLKEVFPGLVRVAALWSSHDPVGIPTLRHLGDAAPRLPAPVRAFDVRQPEDFDGVFRLIVSERLNGLIHQKRIIEFTAMQRLPAISISRDYVDEGGLMSYGPSLADVIGHAATYVAKIRKGAKPSDLPVEQPTKFDLVINLKTAKALGLTIPPSLLRQADQVIE